VGGPAQPQRGPRLWWHLLDDFVPIEAMANGKDPRCATLRACVRVCVCLCVCVCAC